MAAWSRRSIGGRFCEWRRSTMWRGHPRDLTVLPRPGYGFEWSVSYGPRWGVLQGVSRSVFAAMREAELRSKRVKRISYWPAMR